MAFRLQEISTYTIGCVVYKVSVLHGGLNVFSLAFKSSIYLRLGLHGMFSIWKDAFIVLGNEV